MKQKILTIGEQIEFSNQFMSLNSYQLEQVNRIFNECLEKRKEMEKQSTLKITKKASCKEDLYTHFYPEFYDRFAKNIFDTPPQTKHRDLLTLYTEEELFNICDQLKRFDKKLLSDRIENAPEETELYEHYDDSIVKQEIQFDNKPKLYTYEELNKYFSEYVKSLDFTLKYHTDPVIKKGQCFYYFENINKHKSDKLKETKNRTNYWMFSDLNICDLQFSDYWAEEHLENIEEIK